jgi:hypothetical protein
VLYDEFPSASVSYVTFRQKSGPRQHLQMPAVATSLEVLDAPAWGGCGAGSYVRIFPPLESGESAQAQKP